MKPPRGLTAAEAEAWARLAGTVKPLAGRRPPAAVIKMSAENSLSGIGAQSGKKAPPKFIKPASRQARAIAAPMANNSAASSAVNSGARVTPRPRPRPIGQGGLDSHWNKRLKTGSMDPDFTLDLHGHTLDTAHVRLDHGIAQARAMGARLVLVVTGKSRPVDAADRSTTRGAIRSKILDWLAAGRHGDAIAAIRKSHRKHGGDGALYIVLRKN